MKKYFLSRCVINNTSTSLEQIASYRKEVIQEMEKMGATSSEFSLLCEEMILNSMRNNRKPEDLAWAILQ